MASIFDLTQVIGLNDYHDLLNFLPVDIFCGNRAIACNGSKPARYSIQQRKTIRDQVKCFPYPDLWVARNLADCVAPSKIRSEPFVLSREWG